MVKILSNGDIVPDDDPRATRSTSKRKEGENTAQPRVRQVDYAPPSIVKKREKVNDRPRLSIQQGRTFC